jgi:hypothetical protein
MKLIRKTELLLITIVTAALSGCLSGGKPFTRPPLESFELGKTTLTRIIQSLGQPAQVATTEKNGKVITRYYYHDSYATLIAPIIPVSGTYAKREASFYFSNDVLIGYLYTSNYPGDSTDFDEHKVELLTKGKSTRQDVESLLGNPAGVILYPLSDAEQETVLTYAYVYMQESHHNDGIENSAYQYWAEWRGFRHQSWRR